MVISFLPSQVSTHVVLGFGIIIHRKATETAIAISTIITYFNALSTRSHSQNGSHETLNVAIVFFSFLTILIMAPSNCILNKFHPILLTHFSALIIRPPIINPKKGHVRQWQCVHVCKFSIRPQPTTTLWSFPIHLLLLKEFGSLL